jgi:hypothetical protein
MEKNDALVAYNLVYTVLQTTPIVVALVAFGKYRRIKNTEWSTKRTVAAYVGVFFFGAYVGGLLTQWLLETFPPPF